MKHGKKDKVSTSVLLNLEKGTEDLSQKRGGVAALFFRWRGGGEGFLPPGGGKKKRKREPNLKGGRGNAISSSNCREKGKKG